MYNHLSTTSQWKKADSAKLLKTKCFVYIFLSKIPLVNYFIALIFNVKKINGVLFQILSLLLHTSPSILFFHFFPICFKVTMWHFHILCKASCRCLLLKFDQKYGISIGFSMQFFISNSNGWFSCPCTRKMKIFPYYLTRIIDLISCGDN